MLAVICVNKSAQNEALVTVQTGDANVDDPVDLDGEDTSRRVNRNRIYRPQRRRSGNFRRWFFGG